MSIVRTYAVHAIDDESCELPSVASQGRRGFDYADLLKRARIGARERQQPRPLDLQVAPGQEGPGAPASAPARGSNPSDGDGTHAALSDATPSSSPPSSSRKGTQSMARERADALTQQGLPHTDSLTQQLRRLDGPYLDALVDDQRTLFVLADYLCSRVADFCTDPAVLAQGHWMMRLTLDPSILPDCALSMTLSYFDLTLRFETNHASSRQLVLHHADVLQRRLEVLLAQHDAPRTVEIVVQ